MSEDLEHDRFEALSRRMEDLARRMEERIEEYLELSRSMEFDSGVSVMDDTDKIGGELTEYDLRIADYTTTPYRSIGNAGGVSVGVPQFFDVNHLVSVNEAYGGIEDVWLRGRMATWNAQMRIAQGAGDLEAMCLFLQLQLEGLTQVALRSLYVENGCWKREWSANLSFERTEEKQDGSTWKVKETREVRFNKGAEAPLLPYFDFAFQVNVGQQEGRYFEVLEVPEDGIPFDGTEFNELSRNRFLHEVTVRPIGGKGDSRVARIATPVRSLRPVVGLHDIIWVTHGVFADVQDDGKSIEGVRWAVVVESNLSKGRAPLKVQEDESRYYKYRAHIKDVMIDWTTRSIEKRSWRMYAKKENAFYESRIPFELGVRSLKEEGANDFEWMIGDDGVICAVAFRRMFKAGDSYDVMGRFGKNHAHISKKFDMMMLAVDSALGLSWDEEDRRIMDRIREVRNLLAHGNLRRRKGRSHGLTVDDVATFWDTHIQPRIPYWVDHIGKP